MQALAVDNEPEPFWTGEDQTSRIETWMADRDWREEWGTVEPVGSLNGPSGQWVQDSILAKFAVDRSAAWITDCLDTYRASVRMRAAVDSVYQPFAEAHGLSKAALAEHPSENQIVLEARAQHLDRLRRELAAAKPEVVITLGNAALRVFRTLVDVARGPAKLAADESYGKSFDVTVGGMPVRWFPLAHPAAPARYQDLHRAWIAGPAVT